MQSSRAVIACSHRVQSSRAVIACSHRVQSSRAVIACSHRVQSSRAVIACSHRVQSSRAVITCSHHVIWTKQNGKCQGAVEQVYFININATEPPTFRSRKYLEDTIKSIVLIKNMLLDCIINIVCHKMTFLVPHFSHRKPF